MPPRYAGQAALGGKEIRFTAIEDLYCFRPRDLPAIAAAVAKAAAVVSLRGALAASGRESRDA